MVKDAGEEITVAVNTIGISPDTAFGDQTIGGDKGWTEVMAVNVIGSHFVVREMSERMKRNGSRCSVVAITSTNGINSQAGFSAHYDASKAAQAHSLRISAEEFAPYGIRINGVAPGWVQTAMNDSVPKADMEKENAKIWLKRQVDPSEIAAVIAFVAGTGGSYIVGQNIMVDGGYR